ncbi:MAG: hypothetical protein N2749_05350 [Clostridia bacterium]|nr:hypothetical protein [Clostridia bacterium]
MSRHGKKIYDMLFFNKSYTEKILLNIENLKDKEVVAIYNPENIGIMNSTKDLFENHIGINELFKKKQINLITKKITSSNIKQIVFSSNTFGFKELAEKIREESEDIKIKFFWHGSFSMFVQENEIYFFNQIIELLEKNIINGVAFAKESMYEFYKEKGYKSYFLPNRVPEIDGKLKNEKLDIYEDNMLNIGLYSAGERWEKNTYNQLSAASMVKDSVVDILPATELVTTFCDLMNIQIKDERLVYLSREELLKRMAVNDINLYVTFTECSPVIPLESLEMGVPCITGNNHHYFKNSKLYDYLVVKSEDDINEIYEKIKRAIDNKNEIMKLYSEWKQEYNSYVGECFKKFVEG